MVWVALPQFERAAPLMLKYKSSYEQEKCECKNQNLSLLIREDNTVAVFVASSCEYDICVQRGLERGHWMYWNLPTLFEKRTPDSPDQRLVGLSNNRPLFCK